MADAIWTVNSIVLLHERRQTVRMRNYIALLLVSLLVAACAPVSLYYKEGGLVSRQKTDLLSCQVDSLSKAPVANQIRQFPPYYVPGRRYCRSDGDCYTRGGFFAPGEIYSVDVNARLRNDLEAQCMASNGYTSVALPRCTSGSFETTTLDTSTTGPRLPALSESSCVARDTNGNWQIINPNG